jgi:hypothetical protein
VIFERYVIGVLVVASIGCKERKESPRGMSPGSGSNEQREKLDDTQQLLILEAAREKANAELAKLRESTPRDEAAIFEKEQAIEAVTQTMSRIRARMGTAESSGWLRPRQ